MKVYGHPMSTCTRKVLTALAEKGEKPEFVTVEIMKGEGKAPDHLARQPFGRVPAIDDDGFQLFESRAIVRYIDETRTDGTKLHGTDPKSRALVEQWLSVETSEFTPQAMKIIYEKFFHPMMGKPSDEAVVAAARTALEKVCTAMETQLGKTEYIAGNGFTMADIGFMPYIEYLFAAGQGDILDKFPKTLSWWQRISARPSWKTATGKA